MIVVATISYLAGIMTMVVLSCFAISGQESRREEEKSNTTCSGKEK
jgi:hypothetical protein